MTTAPTPPPSPPVIELKLTDEIKQLVKGAFDNKTPLVLGYVDERGRPSLSLRGTTQTYSDDQMAVWARSADGGLLKAIFSNPQVTLLYFDYDSRLNLLFRGRARVEDDEAVRTQVYNNSPPREQAADPDRKGVAIIVDLDEVDGRLPAGRFSMRRS